MKLGYFLFAALFSYSSFAQLASELKSKTLPVLSEKRNIVEVKGSDLQKGQRMIFVRIIPEYDEFEIIAEGAVIGRNSGKTQIKLNLEKLKKIPTKDDFAVLLGEPKTFVEPKTEKTNTIVSLENEQVKEQEPGYISVYLVNLNGQLKSTSSTTANSLKQIDSLKTAGFGLEWFLEFLPSYGIAYEFAGGRVPVYSYFKNEEPTAYDFSEFKVQFRNQHLKPGGWRWKMYISNWNSKFKTTNADAYVLSSQVVSNGFGASIGYDFNPPLYEAPRLWGAPQTLYAGAGFYPDVTIKDGLVSRGESSSGSSQMSMYFGYTHALNFKFIPYATRWFLDLRFSQINQSIKMSGPTQSEKGGFYKIPESGAYREKQTYFEITLGIRFPDIIGAGLTSRN